MSFAVEDELTCTIEMIDAQKHACRSRRRARLSALYFALLVVQLLNAVFYLLPNAYSLGGSCPWYGAVVDVSGFVRWTMWMSA